MPKFTYVAFARMPTEKAHGVQIAKMCEAYTESGVELELILPTRKNNTEKDIFDFYNLGSKDLFTVTYLKTPDFVEFGRLGFLFSEICFLFSVKRYLKNKVVDILFSREYPTFLFFKNMQAKKIYEGHDVNWNNAFEKVAKIVDLIVVTSQGIRDFYIEKGVNKENILVEPNGVDLDEFTVEKSEDEILRDFNVPKDKKVIITSSNLFSWKGVDTLARSADFLSDDYLIVFMGGNVEAVKSMQEKYPSSRVRFVGHVNRKTLAEYHKIAAVGVLANSKKSEFSTKYTSPIKLREYMAAGLAVIAADLPSIRSMVEEEEITYFESDNAEDLAEKIKGVSDQVSGFRKEYKNVEQYSWQARAGRILKWVRV